MRLRERCVLRVSRSPIVAHTQAVRLSKTANAVEDLHSAGRG